MLGWRAEVEFSVGLSELLSHVDAQSVRKVTYAG